MIEKVHMAVTPGAAIGHTAAQNIRLTVATWVANLHQAIGQIK
jgi:hypothetical protein